MLLVGLYVELIDSSAKVVKRIPKNENQIPTSYVYQKNIRAMKKNMKACYALLFIFIKNLV